jgi:NAD-dependent dihydropyrimidine dehydrogenase PreA subunit
VITIRPNRCNGCGACLEVCPNGAIYLVDGQASVDPRLCGECESCIAVCPTGAITITSQPSPHLSEPVRVPVVRPQPEMVRVKAQPSPVPLRARVLPAVGAAVVWAGREIVPRLMDYALHSLERRPVDRRSSRGRAAGAGNGAGMCWGGGWRRRLRGRRG